MRMQLATYRGGRLAAVDDRARDVLRRTGQKNRLVSTMLFAVEPEVLKIFARLHEYGVAIAGSVDSRLDGFTENQQAR